MINELTKSNFDDYIAKEDIVFIDFWAPWCGPCRNFAKVFEQAEQKHQNVNFASVNIEDEESLKEDFQIQSIPHVMVLKKGVAIYSKAGSLSLGTIDELVDQALKADVSNV